MIYDSQAHKLIERPIESARIQNPAELYPGSTRESGGRWSRDIRHARGERRKVLVAVAVEVE